ncbi:MAG: YCF48-related protein [Ignavibacteria bacterium]|nr:YCF48-related protein [Ignavibacteria bacterium]
MKNLFLLLLLYPYLIYAQIHQDWKWLHQLPQGNDLRWVKMWDVNTFYAAGMNGTFIKTTNRGVNWIFHHSAGKLGGIPLQRANIYNVWFFNQNTGIVVGNLGSIMRTTDGGLTFDSVPGNPAPSNVTFRGVYFINELTGYVVSGITNYRLMKTTDGGLNWYAGYGSAPPYSNPYYIYAFNENKLLVLNQLGDICISTNGGNLWNTYYSGTSVNLYKTVFINSDTGFVCGDWGRCRYTTNGGYNWINMAGTMLSQDVHFFNIEYRNGAVYLTGNSNYIWKSSNYGVTWDTIPFIAPQAQLQWENSFYASDFSITGDTIITVGAFGSIHQKLGNQFVTHSTYLKKGNLRDVVVIPSTGVIIAVGGPSVSTTSLTTPDQILRSSDNGIHWVVISPSTNSAADFYSIEMIDNNTGFICGTKSAVYKTTNAGLNWDSLVIPIIPSNVILSKVDFVNSQTGWIFSRYSTGNDSTIFKTTNGGVNWFKQKFGTITGNENSVFSACMIDANTGWLINSKPRPWKTTNGGLTWDSTALGDNYLAGSLYDIKMLNAFTGYCVGSNNRVYRTTNGGATPWSNVSFSSTTVLTLYTCEFINALEGVVLGTYGYAYYTTNGGVTWINKTVSSGTNDIYGSFITQDGKVFAVSLINANIFKNSNLISVGINNNFQNLPNKFILEQNYPNPFNNSTVITYHIPYRTKVVLKVYNILGKEITTLVNAEQDAGKYNIYFNANNLSSGIYFYKLQADEFKCIAKMVLIR